MAGLPAWVGFLYGTCLQVLLDRAAAVGWLPETGLRAPARAQDRPHYRARIAHTKNGPSPAGSALKLVGRIGPAGAQ